MLQRAAIYFIIVLHKVNLKRQVGNCLSFWPSHQFLVDYHQAALFPNSQTLRRLMLGSCKQQEQSLSPGLRRGPLSIYVVQ